jgi:hypothetical protein
MQFAILSQSLRGDDEVASPNNPATAGLGTSDGTVQVINRKVWHRRRLVGVVALADEEIDAVNWCNSVVWILIGKGGREVILQHVRVKILGLIWIVEWHSD